MSNILKEKAFTRERYVNIKNSRLKKFIKENFYIAIAIIVFYIKTLTFTLLIASDTGFTLGAFDINKATLIPHISILAIIIFPSLFFKGRNSLKYIVVLDIFYTLILILDLWTYRGTGHLFEIKYFFMEESFFVLNKGIFQPGIIDILFFLDFIILLIFKRKIKMSTEKRKVKLGIILILIATSIVTMFHLVLDVFDLTKGKYKFLQDHWEVTRCPHTMVNYRSPIGHHIFETIKNISRINNKADISKYSEIDEWLSWNNENLEDNEFKGIAEGKNIIFLQIESLENFVINQKVYGQEITPNLNKLVKNNLYFNNIHEQNNGGNSIDMDMMATSGVLPLGSHVTFLEYYYVKYPSLVRMLNDEGYNTILTHAERAGDWNWSVAGKVATGYKTIWDKSQYEIDEIVGYGLSDRSFYKQFVDKLSKEEGPFFALLPTLSSHGPFEISEEYKGLDLPEELDSNKLGGYFQSIHYADEQIGYFFELLEENNILEDTIVVIYGDHGGVHKYYMEDVKASNIEGDWWQEVDYKIPLIICGEGLSSKLIEATGGHIDIMPTVSYLLGLDTKGYVMGRNLLNTNRDATVLKGGTVVGNPTKEEEEMLKNAYNIADMIIKNNYYENTDKIN